MMREDFKERREGNMKKVILVGICVGFLLAWTGGAGAAEAPKKITIVSGTVGGHWYNSAAVMAQILMKQIPGLNVTATSGVSLGNIRLVDAGVDAQIGWTYLNSLHMAWNAEGPFKKKYTKAVVLMPAMLGSPYLIATKKSGIKDWGDLKGKRLLTPPLAGANEVLTRRILELYGITYKDIKDAGGSVNHIEFGQSVTLMKDGRADAAIVPGSPGSPIPGVLDIASTVELVIPTVRPDIIKKFCEQNPGYIPYPLSPDMYKFMTKPVDFVAGICILITNKDLPDDFVYKVIKAIYENRKQLQEVNRVYRYIDKENLNRGIPDNYFHPGALKYIKEVQGK
jgi:TRAP transporter TAXI family solute receptor